MLIRSIISSFRREVRDIASDRLYLAILVLFPLLLPLFFCAIFYRGAIDDVPIAVVDRDYTPLSRQLCRMVDATSGVSIAFQELDMASAEQRLLNGDVEGILYIDNGFEQSIYRQEGATVGCYLSGANISASGVLSRDITLAVESFSAGVALQSLESMGTNASQAMVEIMPINTQTE